MEVNLPVDSKTHRTGYQYHNYPCLTSPRKQDYSQLEPELEGRLKVSQQDVSVEDVKNSY